VVGWLIVILLFAGVVWSIVRSKKPAPKLKAAESVSGEPYPGD
jgi:hypothetical protein